ncbi:MAG: surface lipoprotein assembly modifier [Sphingomonas sp.]
MPAAASAEVDDLVKQGLALHQAGKPREAVGLLLPFEQQRAGDPDYDYALGLAAADAGLAGVALPALQRVLAIQPGNVQARAEVARVYAMAGDIDTARAEFDTVVLDPSLPDPVRQRFDRLVRDYDRQIAGGGNVLSGFVDLEGGYDSNINQATAAGTVTLPAFAFLGPATLGGGARRMGAGFGQIQAGLSAQSGIDRQTRLFASALGFLRDNADNSQFDQAALTGTAGIGHTLANRDVVSLSAQVQQFWLGHDPYRASYGLIGQFTHRLSGGKALSFSGTYSRLDYHNDRLRDANRYGANVTYAGRSVYATASLGTERTIRAASRHLGNEFAGIQAGIEHPLSRSIAVIGSAAFEYRNYAGSDPLFLKGRQDAQIDASIGLRAVIASGLSVRPRVAWTRNASNLDLYDYQRVTASVGVRAEF